MPSGLLSQLVSYNPWPVDLYSIKRWAVGFSCRSDGHSQCWEKKEIPLCPCTTYLHVKKDITVSLRMITGFAKLLGTLGMGQLNSQSSYCLSFRLILLKGQNISRDIVEADISGLRRRRGLLSPWQRIPLSTLLPPRTGQNVTCRMYTSVVEGPEAYQGHFRSSLLYMT